MKKYTEMMKHIRPTDAQKNRMLDAAINGKSEKKIFKKRYCAAAVAVTLAIPATVFAEDIKSTFYNLLGVSEVVSEDVLNDIYSDTDGHVVMTVKELLSDRINCYAVIKYNALDDDGWEWLESYNPAQEMEWPTLAVEPKIKNSNTCDYGVNYSIGAVEKEELRGENKRVFIVTYNASGDSFGTDSVILKYNMTNKIREKVLDISGSVKYKDIKIDNSLAPDKAYKPTGIKISPLGFMIYGKNIDYYESWTRSDGGLYQRITNDDEISTLYLIMKDGSIRDLMHMKDGQSVDEFLAFGEGGFMLTAVECPDADYDISIYSGSFSEPMDISTVAGIKLDGVYYPID